jgi:tripartite-type tricarboxylate transporter receptor subunit TctC
MHAYDSKFLTYRLIEHSSAVTTHRALAFFAIIPLMLGLALPSDASAQEYPTRPIRLIVATSPGGGNDAIARIVGAKLGELLGQQVVVDNRAGAGGIVGTEMAARAAPDGYTLLMGFISTLVLIPALGHAPYDPIKDLAPVSLIASSQYMLVIHPSVPARTLGEFVIYAKANPGRINYASAGNGTPVHLSAELFKSVAGINLVHIPYKGGGPAAAAVLAGEAKVIFGSISATLPQIKAGRLIALATTGAARSPVAPEYATIAEQGYPGFEVTSWYGVVAPAKTPPNIIAKLNATILTALRAPDVREKMTHQGLDPLGSSPADFASHLKRESVVWRRVIKNAGVRAD